MFQGILCDIPVTFPWLKLFKIKGIRRGKREEGRDGKGGGKRGETRRGGWRRGQIGSTGGKRGLKKATELSATGFCQPSIEIPFLMSLVGNSC